MDRMLYLGMTGAKHTQLSMTTNANNLANVSTAGFRADFHALLEEQIAGPGFATRFNAMSGDRATNLAPGPVRSTGRALDVAVNGDGWLVVRAPDGGEAYTRRGDLHVTPDGLLVNGAGLQVMGDGGPVAIPEHQSLTIGDDGTVSIVPMGQGPETLAVVDRLRLVTLDTADAVKGSDGLIRHGDGRPGIPTAEAKLISGSLEMSNVNAVDALVNMIDLSRQFEMQVKMMKTAQDLADANSRMMRLE